MAKKDRLVEMLNSPPDNVAMESIVRVQTATTQVKQIVTQAVMEGWDDDLLTKRLNECIARNCKNIENLLVREQTRKSLVTSAKKWYYELKASMRTLNTNLANNGVPIQPTNAQTLTYVRQQLNSGAMVGRPIIENYYRQVKIALKSMAVDPPMYARESVSGRIKQTVLRNSAEATVRYEANIKDLQNLVNKGVKLVWTSSHPNCSPRCKPYQGRLWSLDGSSGVINGIKYEPLQEALAGENGDGNSIINGYNCRHRLIEYTEGSRPPQDYSSAEIKKEYGIDKKQRAYENNIRHLKTEEMEMRQAGYIAEAQKLRKKWQKLTKDYRVYSLQQGRAYYPYRCVIDRDIEKGNLGIQEPNKIDS